MPDADATCPKCGLVSESRRMKVKAIHAVTGKAVEKGTVLVELE